MKKKLFNLSPKEVVVLVKSKYPKTYKKLGE